MADFRFINPITVLPQIGGIAGVTIDLTERLIETYSNLITENPIQGGAAVTDYVINLPTKISITGFFVDTPSTNLTGAFTSAKGIAKTKFDKLLTLSIKGTSFNVMDGVHLFKDIQFENVSLIKEDSINKVKFQANLTQIQKVFTLGQGFVELAESNIARAAFMIPALVSSGAIATDQVLPFGILL